jgi:hypothetical protein
MEEDSVNHTCPMGQALVTALWWRFLFGLTNFSGGFNE